jgi:Cof subfamily protein (haloacid dehalogenase superfamily)
MVCQLDARDIKLIATDVDGTLLNHKQELTERTARAFQAAASLGIKVVVATGKAKGPWAEILPRMGPPVAGVFTQGLIVMDAAGKVLYSRDLERDRALEGLALARSRGLTFAAYSNDRVFANVIDEHTDRLVWYGEPVPELAEDLEDIMATTVPIQKYILLAPVDIMQEQRPAIESALGDRVHITTALPGMLEILPQGASKGDGLRRLLDMLDPKIDPKNVMAMGDGENDVEMAQMVGLAVAMGNAVPELRAVADVVVGTNDEEGVAEAIERFVLEPLGALASA